MIFIKKLLGLYFIFLKIGGFTFGSGYAMLPIIRQEIALKRNWINEDEISDYIVFAQSLPGVMAINISCAVGKKIAGIKGSIAACIGAITLPSIIIILISHFFRDIMKIPMVNKIILSIQSVTVAIVLLAFVQIYKSNIKDLFQKVIFVSGIIASIFFKIPTQYIIISACIIACIYKHFMRNKINKK